MSSSNVGNSQVYEAGDQRNYSENDERQRDRYQEGNPNSHYDRDSKDSRTIANKLASQARAEHTSNFGDIEKERLEKDATLPARAHGNKPSRGAQIDQEIREEEEAILKKKGY